MTKSPKNEPMKVVYIASPYTVGNIVNNVMRQMEVADILMLEGFCPIAPLWAHFQNEFFPRPYEMWMRVDLRKVEVSDVVLRLPGESKGAEREVAHAKSRGIPVVFSMAELFQHFEHEPKYKGGINFYAGSVQHS